MFLLIIQIVIWPTISTKSYQINLYIFFYYYKKYYQHLNIFYIKKKLIQQYKPII